VYLIISTEGAASSERPDESGPGSSGKGAETPCSSTRLDGMPESSGKGAEIAGSSGIGGGVVQIASPLGAGGGCSEALRTGKGGCVGNRVVSGRVVVDLVFLGCTCSRAKSLATLVLELLAVSHPYLSANLFPLPLLLAVPALDLGFGARPAVPSSPCGRILADTDSLWLGRPSLSLAACGTPSHFELTFGTVGGNLAEDTPGIPIAVARPLFLRITFW